MPFEPYSPEPAIVSAELALARKVRDLLAVPERWCKVKFRIDPGSCMVGAIMRFGSIKRPESVAVRKRMELICGNRVESFNDHPATTHADIVRVTAALVASFE